MHLGEDYPRGTGPLSWQEIKGIHYQNGMWLLMLTLITWLRNFVMCVHYKLYIAPNLILCFLEGGHSRQPTRKEHRVRPRLSRAEHLHHIFGVHVDDLSLLHLLIQSFIYLIGDSFILYCGSESNTTLFIKLFYLLPGPNTYPHYCLVLVSVCSFIHLELFLTSCH